MIDLEAASQRMSGLVTSVTDDQLGFPTPCPNMTVAALCDHIGMFAKAFTAVARKDSDGARPPGPPDGDRLEPGWRDRIDGDLQTLVAAWRAPSAWQGTTNAGGIELPGEVGGVIALDELVVHGWDLAISTGQAYDPAPADVDAATEFVRSFHAPRDGGLFGPIVPVAGDAPPLDQLLGLAGRDPDWRP